MNELIFTLVFGGIAAFVVLCVCLTPFGRRFTLAVTLAACVFAVGMAPIFIAEHLEFGIWARIAAIAYAIVLLTTFIIRAMPWLSEKL